MNIAIPSDTGDMNSPVSAIFGRAQYFIIFDIENGNIKSNRTIENIAWQQGGGAGITSSQLLVNNGINIVIANAIGPRAISVFAPAKIEMYKAIAGSAKDNVIAFIEGKLEKGLSPGPAYGMKQGGFAQGGRGMGGPGFGRGKGFGFGRGRY